MKKENDDMSNESLEGEELIYASEVPDINSLTYAYQSTLADLDTYFDTCLRSYNDRRNIWDGKTQDLRKSGSTAFPWQGASDQEVNVIGERINTYISIFDQALQRSHIKAFPTSMASMSRAGVVSSFLKWMKSSYIPDFKNQMEQGANYLLEKGLMVTYVGWKRESRTYLQPMTLDEIAQQSPDLIEVILDETNDEVVMTILQQAFPKLSDKRAKKCIKELRTKGETQIPAPRQSVDCPVAYACAPDGEVIFPSYVSDPQRSPWIFWRCFLTAQELEKKVTSEGWDEEWVDNAIDTLRGNDSMYYDGEKMKRSSIMPIIDENQLVMVVYAYQRLIDEEDGSEGIYCTIFHPDSEGYAKHELCNGMDDYPFVVTRLSNDQKRMYEVDSFPEILRGAQMQIKTERDSRIDRASLATLPPIMHPAGRPPSDWGPGRRVPYRRLGEIAFGPVPPLDSGSMEIEMAMKVQADRAVGLDLDNPLATIKQQFFINKFLDHVRDVLTMAWKLYQRLGPDEIFFQVTGNPNGQIMQKGSPDDNFSIVVSFDTQSSDPEVAETQLKNMVSLLQFDRNGRLDTDKLLEFSAQAINPMFADYVLQPAEEAQQKVMKDVTDDLSKIYAGIEVPARPNGAQIAMQMLEAYVQQPDVAQRAQSDEAFGQRLQKYAEQYQFQMQQMQNAQIGRIGTAPAEMGGMQTQGMQQ
jgi:hypothetical protein